MKNEIREEIPQKYGAKPETSKWPAPVAVLPVWGSKDSAKVRGRVVTCPEDVISYLNDYIANAPKEVFLCIYLDHRNHVIYADARVGTVDHTAVYPREILTTVLAWDATGIILAHNHPAGSLEPSEGDKQLTRQIVTASRAMGVTVHDHLIMTNEGHFSFRQAGLLS